MNQKPIIRLDYLCSEPFWKFKKENGIDYCKVCKHTITDFTHLENEELIKVLKEQKKGFCGKYYEDQLIIDDQTKKGPSLYKIILASTIASIVSITSNAQIIKKDSVKTEQLSLNSKLENISSSEEEEIGEVECYQVPEEETVVSSGIKGRKYYKIGNSSFYFNKKFPFVHKRRIRMGALF